MSSVQDLQLTDLNALLISQYNDAEKLQTLIDDIFIILQTEQINVLKEIQNSIDLDNAGSFFLDVLGENFGYPRPLIRDADFINDIPDDAFYLKLIKAFILGLFFDDTAIFVNKVLQAAYQNGFIIDRFDMTASIVIDRGGLTTQAISDILATGLPIRPAGKLYNVITIPTDGDLFGFDGIGKGFDQAPFATQLGDIQ